MLKKITLVSAVVLLTACETMPSVSSMVPGSSSSSSASTSASAEVRANRECIGPQPTQNLSLIEQAKIKALNIATQKAVKAATGTENIYKSATKIDNTCKADKALALSEKAMGSIADVSKQVDKRLVDLGVSADRLGDLRATQDNKLNASNKNNNAGRIEGQDAFISGLESIKKENASVAKQVGLTLYQGLVGSSYRVLEATQNIGKTVKFAKTVPQWAINAAPALKSAASNAKPLAQTGKSMWEMSKSVVAVFGLSKEEVNKSQEKQKLAAGSESDLD